MSLSISDINIFISSSPLVILNGIEGVPVKAISFSGFEESSNAIDPVGSLSGEFGDGTTFTAKVVLRWPLPGQNLLGQLNAALLDASRDIADQYFKSARDVAAVGGIRET